MARANEWMREQTKMRFISIQSIDTKINSGKCDSGRMSYTHRGSWPVILTRFVRVAFVHLEESEYRQTSDIYYKQFSPSLVRLGNFLQIATYETMSETVERAIEWLQEAKAKVLNVQTCYTRIYISNEEKISDELTHEFVRADRYAHYIHIIRVYIEGPYHQPNPRKLREIKEPHQPMCCPIQ